MPKNKGSAIEFLHHRCSLKAIRKPDYMKAYNLLGALLVIALGKMKKNKSGVITTTTDDYPKMK